MPADTEFSIIEEFFSPLSRDADGAAQLKDDVAVLARDDYVVTNDMMIAGVHCRADDALDDVARKLLRVNLSDLAAKGARPIGYFLACAWPAGATRKDIAAFVDGLERDQDAFHLALFGGDTTVHRDPSAPLVASVSMFGAPPRHGVVRRDGAASGDDVYVSGTIGDGFLGLQALEKKAAFSRTARAHVTARYLTPTPRIVFGSAIAGFASATIDVSDGLIADAGHIARASGADLRIVLRADELPLSEAAEGWIAAQDDEAAALAALASGGAKQAR
ncbi:MAG: thiamine-phosphate kinase [Pseudomonadota bacterium]